MKYHYFGIVAPERLTIAGEIDLIGVKETKGRITVLGCTNVTGIQKCKPIIIVKTLCPCCLK
jgi:hypothetical protein